MHEFYAEGSIVESTSLKDIHLIRHRANNKQWHPCTVYFIGPTWASRSRVGKSDLWPVAPVTYKKALGYFLCSTEYVHIYNPMIMMTYALVNILKEKSIYKIMTCYWLFFVSHNLDFFLVICLYITIQTLKKELSDIKLQF